VREIRPDVFVEDRYSTFGDYHGCNYGFVVTSAGPVVIDTPQWPSDAVTFREELDDHGDVQFLINTHEHIDHVTGNHYVPGTVVSHEGVRAALTGTPDPADAETMFDIIFEASTAEKRRDALAEIESETFDWEAYMRLVFEEVDEASLEHLDGYRMRPPDVTFTDEATLHVGDCTFELLHLPGHVESHIGVYVPEKELLFAGDNVTTECYPSVAASDPDDWLDSLRRMEDLPVDCVVPGHGAVGGAEAIPEFRSFLETAIERVEDGIDEGLSAAELAERVSFTDLRPALHPMEASHRHDVDRLYEALS